jgi:hypothetical protein
MRTWTFTALIVTLLGCGTKGATPGDGAEAPAERDPAASTPFASMTGAQKGQFMGQVVLPRMAEVFKGHDAQRYAKFDCSTCHGDNADAVGFHMPNDLPALPAADPMAQANAHDPAVAKFMAEVVTPTMRELLQAPPSDAAEGFDCFGCHPKA